MYYKYNDYELLYYIEDGCEIAFEILLKKYEILANKLAIKYCKIHHIKDDLLQEGLMVVWKCIKCFDQRRNVSFYSFVHLCIEHKYISLCQKNKYYQNTNFLSEDCIDYSTKNHYLYRFEKLFDDDLDKLIYKECFLDGVSINYFSKKYSYKYSLIRLRYNRIRSNLKKILTN